MTHAEATADEKTLLAWIGHGAILPLYEDVARAIFYPGLPGGTSPPGQTAVPDCLPRLIAAINSCANKGWLTRWADNGAPIALTSTSRGISVGTTRTAAGLEQVGPQHRPSLGVV